MRNKFITIALLAVVATAGCNNTDSNEPNPGHVNSREAEVTGLQLKKPEGAKDPPGRQTFQINWTNQPDTDDERLVGVWGKDPETGESRFYTAEELRRQTK